MSFAQLKSVLATGGQHLGDVIWWTLAEARITAHPGAVRHFE